MDGEPTPGVGDGVDSGTAIAVARRFVYGYDRLSVGDVLLSTTADVEVSTPASSVAFDTFQGTDGIHEWIGRCRDEWAFLELLRQRYEIYRGWVLVTLLQRGRGKTYPHEIEVPLHVAMEITDGRIRVAHAALDRETAVEFIDARVEGREPLPAR